MKMLTIGFQNFRISKTFLNIRTDTDFWLCFYCPLFEEMHSGRENVTGDTERQKILSFIYPIYNHNWRNISTVYIYNKTSIKRNILTIKQNTGVLISP